jgi:hypothetical protein
LTAAVLALPVRTDDRLDVARAAALIAGCGNLDDLREIRDKAKAIQTCDRTRRAGVAAQQDAAEVVLRAERRLGELCKEVTGGKAGGRAHRHDAPSNSVLLQDLDITKAQSSRWQKLAAVPETVFKQHVIDTRARCEKLTMAGTIAAAFDGSDCKSSDAAVARLALVPSGEPREMTETVGVTFERFRTMLDIAVAAVSKDRSSMRGVHLVVDGDRLTATSTDGRRLMRAEIPATSPRGSADVFLDLDCVTRLRAVLKLYASRELRVGIGDGLRVEGDFGVVERPPRYVVPPDYNEMIPPKSTPGGAGVSTFYFDPQEFGTPLKVLEKHGFKRVQFSVPNAEREALRIDASNPAGVEVVYVVLPRRLG